MLLSVITKFSVSRLAGKIVKTHSICKGNQCLDNAYKYFCGKSKNEIDCFSLYFTICSQE